MLEVIPHGNGFTWRWIAACGRILVALGETFPCDATAITAAKAYRNRFWHHAAAIDHGQGVQI